MTAPSWGLLPAAAVGGSGSEAAPGPSCSAIRCQHKLHRVRVLACRACLHACVLRLQEVNLTCTGKVPWLACAGMTPDASSPRHVTWLQGERHLNMRACMPGFVLGLACCAAAEPCSSLQQACCALLLPLTLNGRDPSGSPVCVGRDS